MASVSHFRAARPRPRRKSRPGSDRHGVFGATAGRGFRSRPAFFARMQGAVAEEGIVAGRVAGMGIVASEAATAAAASSSLTVTKRSRAGQFGQKLGQGLGRAVAEAVGVADDDVARANARQHGVQDALRVAAGSGSPVARLHWTAPMPMEASRRKAWSCSGRREAKDPGTAGMAAMAASPTPFSRACRATRSRNRRFRLASRRSPGPWPGNPGGRKLPWVQAWLPISNSGRPMSSMARWGLGAQPLAPAKRWPCPGGAQGLDHGAVVAGHLVGQFAQVEGQGHEFFAVVSTRRMEPARGRRQEGERRKGGGLGRRAVGGGEAADFFLGRGTARLSGPPRRKRRPGTAPSAWPAKAAGTKPKTRLHGKERGKRLFQGRLPCGACRPHGVRMPRGAAFARRGERRPGRPPSDRGRRARDEPVSTAWTGYSVTSITLEALTMALTASPSLRPMSSTECLVMTDVMATPRGDLDDHFAADHALVMDLTVPGNEISGADFHTRLLVGGGRSNDTTNREQWGQCCQYFLLDVTQLKDCM